MTEYDSSLTYDKDQYALAEQLSQRRARLSHNIANTALDDATTIATLGFVEPTPASYDSHEQPVYAPPTTETIRSLGAAPLNTLMVRNAPSVEQMLNYQDSLAA